MADASSPLSKFQLWRALLPPALRALLTVNLVTYAVFVILSIVGAGAILAQWFALPADPAGLLTRPWTVLTWGVTNVRQASGGSSSSASAWRGSTCWGATSSARADPKRSSAST